MKKDEFIKQVSEVLKLKSEDITKLFSEEDADIDLSIPKGEFWTEENFTTRIKNEKNASYSEGKKAGEEMPVKEIRNELGIDLNGEDTVKNLISVYKQKLETELKKEPNKALEEKEQIITKLKSNISELETEKQNIIKEQKNGQLNNRLLSLMNGELSDGWDREDVITLFRSKYQPEEIDGKTVVKQNGNILRDEKTQEELTIDAVFDKFIKEKSIIKQGQPGGQPGRGGKNEPGGSGIGDISMITNTATYNEYLKSNDIKPGSPEDIGLIKTLSKDNPQTLQLIVKGE